jgi:hypothetical protein
MVNRCERCCLFSFYGCFSTQQKQWSMSSSFVGCMSESYTFTFAACLRQRMIIIVYYNIDNEMLMQSICTIVWMRVQNNTVVIMLMRRNVWKELYIINYKYKNKQICHCIRLLNHLNIIDLREHQGRFDWV